VNSGCALFDTAVGRCGIAWRNDAVVGFALPGEDDQATLAPLLRKVPGLAGAEPPPFVADAIDSVCALLAGEPADLTAIALDLSGAPEFEQRVYAALRAVPPGETVTYGELAERVGSPGAARAVGAAMGRNPIPIIIPCHRVLAGGGRSGGFSAPGGTATKFRLLQIEQARRGSETMLFPGLPLAVAPPPRR
jgi:methylated-DNA-[protein]-cysteine S-methyltransferase